MGQSLFTVHRFTLSISLDNIEGKGTLIFYGIDSRAHWIGLDHFLCSNRSLMEEWVIWQLTWLLLVSVFRWASFGHVMVSGKAGLLADYPKQWDLLQNKIIWPPCLHFEVVIQFKLEQMFSKTNRSLLNFPLWCTMLAFSKLKKSTCIQKLYIHLMEQPWLEWNLINWKAASRDFYRYDSPHRYACVVSVLGWIRSPACGVPDSISSAVPAPGVCSAPLSAQPRAPLTQPWGILGFKQ